MGEARIEDRTKLDISSKLMLTQIAVENRKLFGMTMQKDGYRLTDCVRIRFI